MKLFARGQRSRLDALTSSLDMVVELSIQAPGVAFDFCCFGLDQDGQLSDDRFFVFFNQVSAPDGAIEIQGGAGSQKQKFRVRLDKLPAVIRRLVFTASLDGSGTMAQIRAGSLSLSESGQPELLRYEFAGSDFSSEGALMLGEIYFKDAWRFWAVGQGFAGNLSALLKYFGGEEVSDGSAASSSQSPATPATTPAQPLVQPLVPPAPLSPPALLVSTSLSPAAPALAPVVAVGGLDGSSLQSLIDSAPAGGTVEIGHGEFGGPIVISRPLSLQGAGGVIWAQLGPVVTITSANVSLSDVEIQVTAPEDAAGAQGDVALLAQAGTSPRLHSLRVRGRVLGTGDGGGDWKLPTSLELGELAPRALNSFELEVTVPVACSLACSVAGVTLEPARLEPGTHSVRLLAREVPPESFVCGRIEVRSGEIVRSIPLWGRSALPGEAPVQNRRLG